METRALPTLQEISGPTPGQRLRRRIFGHRALIIGAVVLGLIILTAVLASWIAPHDPYEQNLTARLLPPVWHTEGTWTHPLGTDRLGRDYLSRLMYGARVSLLIGFSVALLSGLIGTAMGVTAGYFGGWADMIITFFITVRLSMPVVLVALAVVAMFGGSLSVIIVVLGFMLWNRYAVVARTTTMQIRSLDFVDSAKTLGCSVPHIVLSEIMPNIFSNLVVVATLEMANAILLEAALSFLGLGVQPPLPSWGLMISEGKEYLLFDPWLITIPGVCLLLLVLAINMVGDGIRDVTVPESMA